MSGDLPVPVERQLQAEPDGPVTRYYLYARGQGKRLVGSYDGRDRWLVKRVRLDRHAFLERPGIAWNLELIARADNARPRPRGVVVTVVGGEPYSVAWNVVRAYARAALDGDERYLVDEDVDRQVLLPWAVLKGEETAPPIPARVLDGRAFRNTRANRAQTGPTLFDSLEETP